MTTFLIVVVILAALIFLYMHYTSDKYLYDPAEEKSRIKVSKDEEKRYKQLGYSFVKYLTTGDYEKAFDMLETNYKKQWSSSLLKERYEKMINYGEGPATNVEVVESMNDWPERKDGDIGWVYVAIEGSSFAEAVTVITSNEDGNYKIRDIEWGRP